MVITIQLRHLLFFQLFYNILHWLNTPCRIQSVRPASNLACEKGGREKGEGKREGRRVQERKIGESAFNGSQVARLSVRRSSVRARAASLPLFVLSAAADRPSERGVS